MNNNSTTLDPINPNADKLSQTDIKLIERNTRLSENSILDYYIKFLSKYNNGLVNREQFNQIIKKLFISNQTNDSAGKAREEGMKSMCERLFDICDHDEDGYIDFKEYLVLFWSRANGSDSEKLSLIFDMYDLNANGYIDFYELHSIVKILFKSKYDNQQDDYSNIEESTTTTTINTQNRYSLHSGAVMFNSSIPKTYYIAMNIMKTFDSDRNAKLTKEEFINGCLAHENIRKFLSPLKVL